MKVIDVDDLFSLESDVERGFENGYPPCCIFWYSTLWSPLCNTIDWDDPDPSPEAVEAEEVHWRYFSMRLRVKHKFDYIPCPACLLSALREFVAHETGAATGAASEPSRN